MSRRRWKSDGPVMSAQGYGHSWVIVSAIYKMSRAAAEARAETAQLWHLLHDHPEFVPTREELWGVPPEKLIERLHDLRRRLDDERARRKAVLSA